MDILMQTHLVKQRMLAHEASRWVGTTELGGNNHGQCVEMFQRAVDGKAHGEAWCLGFTFFCVKAVDAYFDAIIEQSIRHHKLFETEHCMTLWAKTPESLKQTYPAIGTIAIWQKSGGDQGHAGIVSQLAGEKTFFSIEGNTKGMDSIERDGDGVFERERSRFANGSFSLLGFIRPW